MVLFDANNCFSESLDAAFLIHTTVNTLLDQQFPTVGFKCGIGIDFGKMLVTKAGVVKMGKENSPNKSLVWLGRPANIASKLTDNANKDFDYSYTMIEETHIYPLTKQFSIMDYTPFDFARRLLSTSSQFVKHIETYFNSFRIKNYPNKFSTS